jgi:hypothetical protein
MGFDDGNRRGRAKTRGRSGGRESRPRTRADADDEALQDQAAGSPLAWVIPGPRWSATNGCGGLLQGQIHRPLFRGEFPIHTLADLVDGCGRGRDCDIPQLHGAVHAAGGQGAPVRAEGHRGDGAAVASECGAYVLAGVSDQRGDDRPHTGGLRAPADRSGSSRLMRPQVTGQCWLLGRILVHGDKDMRTTPDSRPGRWLRAAESGREAAGVVNEPAVAAGRGSSEVAVESRTTVQKGRARAASEGAPARSTPVPSSR